MKRARESLRVTHDSRTRPQFLDLARWLRSGPEYLEAGLIDELHVAIAPRLLGSGEHLNAVAMGIGASVLLAREFGDFRYGRAHRLTVDTYSLQHPDEYMRSAKSFVAHLTGMHAAMSDTAREVNPIVQRWLSRERVLERPTEPAARQRGALTVAHVHAATGADDHVRRVREWAGTVWEAWREHHQLAAQGIDEAVAAAKGRAVE